MTAICAQCLRVFTMTATSQEFCTPAHRKQYLKEIATEKTYKRLCTRAFIQMPDSTGNNYHNSDEHCPEDEP